MDDRSVLQPVDLVGAGGEVQVDVDVLGSVNPSVGDLSGCPGQPTQAIRGRKLLIIPLCYS